MSVDILERTSMSSRPGSVSFERRNSLTDIVADMIDSCKNFGISNVPAAGTRTESDNEDQTRQVKQIIQLAERFQSEGSAEQLVDLVKNIRPFLKRISKAKAAKLVKVLIDLYLEIAPTELGIALCTECIQWAIDEKRIYLRQSLQAKLMFQYNKSEKFQDAIRIGEPLLVELKKMDDKQMLIDVQLAESIAYHRLGNIQKARGSLTSGRTAASAIYCPPKMQANLDLQSGILHAAEKKDWKTAFSYFYEAFEGYDSTNAQGLALTSLKYMLLCKIMLKQADECKIIVQGKLALKYQGRPIDAILAVADACIEGTVIEFKKILAKFIDELAEDPIIQAHIDTLYDNLLETNLLKVVESYSCVQISRIAELIQLPSDVVERKLSQMILDETLSGVLSQGDGVLMIYQKDKADDTFTLCLDFIQDMGEVVDSLYKKGSKL